MGILVSELEALDSLRYLRRNEPVYFQFFCLGQMYGLLRQSYQVNREDQSTEQARSFGAGTVFPSIFMILGAGRRGELFSERTTLLPRRLALPTIRPAKGGRDRQEMR